jgi:hypothetical protein
VLPKCLLNKYRKHEGEKKENKEGGKEEGILKRKKKKKEGLGKEEILLTRPRNYFFSPCNCQVNYIYTYIYNYMLFI